MTWLAGLFASDIAKKLFAFFFDTAIGECVVIGTLVTGLVVGFAMDQRSVGRTQAHAEMEAKDAKSIELSSKARAASRSNVSGGVRDPYTRAE